MEKKLAISKDVIEISKISIISIGYSVDFKEID